MGINCLFPAFYIVVTYKRNNRVYPLNFQDKKF